MESAQKLSASTVLYEKQVVNTQKNAVCKNVDRVTGHFNAAQVDLNLHPSQVATTQDIKT
jgi:hypothetical protein